MDTTGRISSENDSLDRIGEAIRELSKQLQNVQQINSEESERLKKYREEGVLLDFTLVTGGLIKGKLLWTGSQSFEIEAESGQNIILFKHAVAFIQEQTE